MCIDEVDKNGTPMRTKLWGREVSKQVVDITLIPCIPEQITDANRHLVNKKCLADYNNPASLKAKFNASKAYLGRPAMEIVSNQ